MEFSAKDTKQKYDIIDTKFNLKKFFKLIYRDKTEEEFIRVFQNNKTNTKDSTYNKVEFFNNIDDLVQFSTNKYIKYNNTYFELATTDGEGGAEEHLKYRYCLAFDFDKKDLGADFTSKDILNKFKAKKIHYHALIDSGNGYHVYVMINKTNNIKMVDEVQKALCEKLGADSKASLSTQILRVPYTFNIKDYPKRVKIIKCDDRNSDKFRAYDIEFLYKMNCNEFGSREEGQIKFTLNNTNIPVCITNILNNGTLEGDRYQDLQRIVVMLRQRNKSLGEIIQVCKEWAIKSQYDDNLDYRINNIYNNLNYISMNCKECEHRQECYSVVVSDFDFDNNYDVFTLEDKLTKTLKTSKRKGAKSLNGNELLIINVLKNNDDGLYKSEIVKKITYKKQCRLSEPTLIKTLKSLVDKEIITVVKGNARAGIENFYTINPIRCKPDNMINISYLATSMCICRLITPTELQLYHYMRYLHHEQQQKGQGLRGNLFQFNQSELAKGFYGADTTEGQGNISKMINNLLECHILDIWERQVSKNNNFEFYIYKLNS